MTTAINLIEVCTWLVVDAALIYIYFSNKRYYKRQSEINAEHMRALEKLKK